MLLRNPITEISGGISATESDEIQPSNSNEDKWKPTPWRMTYTPQPAATHPGIPKAPEQPRVEDLAIDPPKTVKEAYDRMVEANWEYRKASAIKDRTLRQKAVAIAWRKYRTLGKIWYEMQQGPKPPPQSSAMVSVAVTLSQKPEMIHQRWVYAAIGNLQMTELLKAYDEMKIKADCLLADIKVLKMENEQLRETIAAHDAYIKTTLEPIDGEAPPGNDRAEIN